MTSTATELDVLYLGDPRRTAPEKLRTILRQPIRSTTDPATAGR